MSYMLSCVRCGARGKIETIQEQYGHMPEFIYVKCTGCWFETPMEATSEWELGRGTYSVLRRAKDRVFKEWNRRP